MLLASASELLIAARVDVLAQDVEALSLFEKRVPECNQLVQQAAQAPDVAAEIVGLPLDDLSGKRGHHHREAQKRRDPSNPALPPDTCP